MTVIISSVNEARSVHLNKCFSSQTSSQVRNLICWQVCAEVRGGENECRERQEYKNRKKRADEATRSHLN